MAFKKIVPPLPQVAVSSPSSESKSNENANLWEPCSRSLAAERATILTGCYKRDEAADPEIFIRAATAILEQYPEGTVRKVTHPASGLPAKLKWLPSIAELKEACEEDVGHIRRNAERAKHWEGLKQIPAPPVTEESKARVEAIVERFKGTATGRDKELERKQAGEFLDALEARVARGDSPLNDYPSNPLIRESNEQWLAKKQQRREARGDDDA
jgi:hypothetical protein